MKVRLPLNGEISRFVAADADRIIAVRLAGGMQRYHAQRQHGEGMKRIGETFIFHKFIGLVSEIHLGKSLCQAELLDALYHLWQEGF